MFCSKCGKSLTNEAKFCASCGSEVPNTVAAKPDVYSFSPASSSNPPTYFENAPEKTPSRGKLGFGIAGLILGILALAFGLSDYSGISSGGYGYLFTSEIGILALLSIAGATFGGLSISRKQAIGGWALGVSVAALLLDFYLAQFAG